MQVPVDADGRHDLDAMAAAVTDRTKVVIVCTPNNPTGPSVTDAELRAFVAQVPDHVLVVVDEAYREFVREDDPVDGLALPAAHANVAVMRTFAKAYGLAGFRVGYARRARGGRRRRTRLRAAVRRLQRRPGRRRGQPRRRGGAAGAGRRDRGRARPRGRCAARRRAGPSPSRRATSSGCRWASARPSSSPLAEEAGITVRPFAGEGVRVSIGEPEANDVFLGVAGRLRAA